MTSSPPAPPIGGERFLLVCCLVWRWSYLAYVLADGHPTALVVLMACKSMLEGGLREGQGTESEVDRGLAGRKGVGLEQGPLPRV